MTPSSDKGGKEPAFPQTIDDMGTMRSVTSGLTKREWFAGMALQGLLANSYKEDFRNMKALDHAINAFDCADAMIEASKQ